ncbi:MAG: hypothetical protein HS115_08905 [Spirochaetales bacterium]|nr:hypothetical protein [Spirochaetales bacterium]
MQAKERFIVDENGQKVQVILEIARYREMLEALEDLEDIRAYDEAISAPSDPIPLEEAIAEIERNRP